MMTRAAARPWSGSPSAATAGCCRRCCELKSESVYALAVEAAQLIADPQLYADLCVLREWWDVDKELLEDAISACSPAPMIVEMTDQAC